MIGAKLLEKHFRPRFALRALSVFGKPAPCKKRHGVRVGPEGQPEASCPFSIVESGLPVTLGKMEPAAPKGAPKHGRFTAEVRRVLIAHVAKRRSAALNALEPTEPVW